VPKAVYALYAPERTSPKESLHPFSPQHLLPNSQATSPPALCRLLCLLKFRSWIFASSLHLLDYPLLLVTTRLIAIGCAKHDPRLDYIDWCRNDSCERASGAC